MKGLSKEDTLTLRTAAEMANCQEGLKFTLQAEIAEEIARGLNPAYAAVIDRMGVRFFKGNTRGFLGEVAVEITSSGVDAAKARVDLVYGDGEFVTIAGLIAFSFKPDEVCAVIKAPEAPEASGGDKKPFWLLVFVP